MEATLDMAKVTTKGQITIPKAIREALGVKTGDKVLFVVNGDGTVGMRNATLAAFAELQEAFAGAADEAGLETEEDVVAMIKEIRRERAGR